MNIKPLRQYNESDVINMFAYDGAAASKGTLVKVTGNGWKNTDEPTGVLAAAGGTAVTNTVSSRYGTTAKVTASAAGNHPLGMLLMSVQEADENGEKLIFNPRKAAEMGVVVEGQTVPILTRGVVLYYGATLAAETFSAGATLYAGAAGEITSAAGTSNVAVGIALGGKDSDDYVLVKLGL